jgi:hypothetical protein
MDQTVITSQRSSPGEPVRQLRGVEAERDNGRGASVAEIEPRTFSSGIVKDVHQETVSALFVAQRNERVDSTRVAGREVRRESGHESKRDRDDREGRWVQRRQAEEQTLKVPRHCSRAQETQHDTDDS